MKIIIGLGNPGELYHHTRHNIGFLCLDYLNKNLKCDDWREDKKWKVDRAEGIWNGEKIILCKPLTYMNLSGEAVSAILRFYKCGLEDIVVIYDDIDLPFGKIRMRCSGSSGGHKGMQSIIDMAGTQDIPRIRVGIDSRTHGARIETKDYVLSRFTVDEEQKLSAVWENILKGLTVYFFENPEQGIGLLNA